MNDLLANSFRGNGSPPPHPDIEMGVAADGTSLQKFFEDVDVIKSELKGLETLHDDLQRSHEQSKSLFSAQSVKELRSKMDGDVAASLRKAKLIKALLESLDKSNAANRAIPGCGPGSSSDRTRTSLVNGLRKKLRDTMNSFNDLRRRMGEEYRSTVQRRYYTVTGESADEATVDELIATGQSETFLQKAIMEQGRGQVMETIMEIQERHDAVRDIERNLKELHQVFSDMAVLVDTQGEQLDDIESHVNRASSFVRDGAQQLQTARKHQKNTRKWTCFAILLLLIIIAVVVLSLRPWK